MTTTNHTTPARLAIIPSSTSVPADGYRDVTARLPDHVLTLIFNNLQGNPITTIVCVCRRWRRVLRKERGSEVARGRALDPQTVLPVELMAAIFDELVWPDVFVCSRVSRAWRRLGHASQLYWRYLTLEGQSAGRLNLLDFRQANRPAGSLFNLEVTTDDMTRDTAAWLADFIKQRHAYIEVLSIDLEAKSENRQEFEPILLDALRAKPAPNLRTLDLHFDGATALELPLPVLPPNIFQGHAPMLHTVRLTDVILPDTTVPAFSTVEITQCDEDPTRTHLRPSHVTLDQYMTVFPAARHVELRSSGLAGVGLHTLSSPLLVKWLQALDYLELCDMSASTPTSIVLSALPGADNFRSIGIVDDTSSAMLVLLEHFKSCDALGMALEHDEFCDGFFVISLADPSSQRMRKIKTDIEWHDKNSIFAGLGPAVLFHPDHSSQWAAALVFLALPLSLGPIVSIHLPELKMVDSLVISVDDDWGEGKIVSHRGWTPLRLPKLRRLEFWNERCGHLAHNLVLPFVEHVIGATPEGPFQVWVTGPQMSGERIMYTTNLESTEPAIQTVT